MGIGDIFQMMMPLFFIVLLLGGTWYFINKKKVIQNFSKYNPIPIDIVSVKSIMPKKFIAVVKVEDKLLVLGVSDNGINLLQEKDFDESYLRKEEGPKLKSKFQEILKSNWPH